MEASGLSSRDNGMRTLPLSALVLRASLIAFAALLALAGAVLCARQFVGALTVPLSTNLLLSCTVLVALGVSVCRADLTPRLATNHPTTSVGQRAAVVGCWLAGTLILALWGWGLSVPGTSALGLLAVWAPFVAESAWSAGRAWNSLAHVAPRAPRLYKSEEQETPTELDASRGSKPAEPVAESTAAPLGHSDVPVVEAPRKPMTVFQENPVPEVQETTTENAEAPSTVASGEASDRSAPAAETLEAEVDQELPELAEAEQGVWQRMTRRHDPVAGEMITGWVQVDLAAGQRHGIAHVAICPPLDTVPTCYVEQADGPSAQIKVAQVLAHGIRFEIKLDAASPEPAAVALEFAVLQHADVQAE